MKRYLFLIIGLIAVVGYILVGNTGINEQAEDKETKNIQELVHDYSAGNKKSLSASITSQQLIVNDSEKGEVTYDLPEDEFFVSIAPYVEETHP